jgi:hypothetical protein
MCNQMFINHYKWCDRWPFSVKKRSYNVFYLFLCL